LGVERQRGVWLSFRAYLKSTIVLDLDGVSN